MKKFRQIAGLTLLVLAIPGGYAAGSLMNHGAAPHPAACSVPFTAKHQDATTVRSGDAGWYWLPGSTHLSEFVCTDGTLVHTALYGNRQCPTEDSCGLDYYDGEWHFTNRVF